MSLSFDIVPYEADYYRDYGVHEFALADGTKLTAVSSQTWEVYEEQLNLLPGHTEGYVVSADLITASGLWLAIPERQELIESRILTAQAVSEQHSTAQFVVGTPLFENETAFSGAIAIEDGVVTAEQRKLFLHADESDIFAQPPEDSGDVFDSPNHRLSFFSDLIEAASAGIEAEHRPWETAHEYSARMNWLIDPGVESLIVSTYWSLLPSLSAGEKQQRDELYRRVLEKCAGRVLTHYAQVKEIVVIDRAVTYSEHQPYNAHFRRA